MEFSEKLQVLRRDRGMTQEELAQALFVSRTAVSKWESGKGYPGIDSLKAIARFFGVSIDDLLSGEKLISIAERENRATIQRIYGLLFAAADVAAGLLAVLPLYPKVVDGFVYSVNLPAYTEAAVLNRTVYWILLLALTLLGAANILMICTQREKRQRVLRGCSMLVGMLAVVILALGSETYAVVAAFLLLMIKGALLLRMPLSMGQDP